MFFLKSVYYDGTKILSMLDINGNKPELYLITSNRSGGKTTYFGRLCVNRFKEKGEKFALIYRYNYELDDCAEKFFKDLSTLFFNGSIMTSKRRASGIFHELFLDDEPCGYAISLNSADQLKKYSHLFSDVERMIFDEFQSETNHYCSDEIRKFISVHTSVARGQGKQSRYVPVFMLSNPVSIINPYFVELGISERLKDDTKFLRGNGFILEQGFIETASRAQKIVVSIKHFLKIVMLLIVVNVFILMITRLLLKNQKVLVDIYVQLSTKELSTVCVNLLIRVLFTLMIEVIILLDLK